MGLLEKHGALLAQKEAEALTKTGGPKAIAAWKAASAAWRLAYETLEEDEREESVSRSWDSENRYHESLANRRRDGFDGWGA